MNILLVEDNPIVADALAITLEEAGYLPLRLAPSTKLLKSCISMKLTEFC